jgi:hypothetical protein
MIGITFKRRCEMAAVREMFKTLSGEDVEVHFIWHKYYPNTFEYPEEGGLEEITEVWWEDDAGDKVNIMPLLTDKEIEHLESQIWDAAQV